MARKKGKGLVKHNNVWKFFDDGIWEMFLGLVVIWGGFITLQQWPILWILIALILLFLVYLLKKKFVYPHVKLIRIKFGKRRMVIELMVLVAIIFFVMMSILKKEPGLAGYWLYMKENVLIMAGIFSSIVSFFIAFITKSPQFYLHGILLLLTFYIDASVLAEKPLGLVMGAGTVMLVSGGVNFKQFFQSSHK
jgi:hypothetical protein